jgi:hypothetical protein
MAVPCIPAADRSLQKLFYRPGGMVFCGQLNGCYWPIVLKNSVLAVNEKTLAPQADLEN